MFLGNKRTFVTVIVTCIMVLIGNVTTISGSEVRGKRSDDGGPLEVVVQQLSQQVTSLTAQLTQLNAEVTSLKAKTNTLDTSVAFHAWGNHHPIQTLAHGPLILDHVTTNIGHAYDASTGVFSAPVAGLYAFLATIMEYTTTNSVNAGIFVNGVMQAFAISDNRNGANYHQGPLHVVVHLDPGAKVTLTSTADAVSNFYGGSPYTTFSGFLVKAD